MDFRMKIKVSVVFSNKIISAFGAAAGFEGFCSVGVSG
jgi:hypothetical protein